ncbi:MAG: 4Fe-4S dicluster domain-containing protein [Peptococcaceae bacterium]|nr:4Fe-4S dicluster domain-containing protein [Peptococcaceae bacterium]
MKKEERAKKLSRRSFVKLAGGATLAGTALGIAGFPGLAQAANSAEDGLNKSNAVLVDIPKCIGCESCTVACKVSNELAFNQQEQAKTAKERAEEPGKGLVSGTWTSINLYEPVIKGETVRRFVKNQCFHCHQPACASACFAKALYKTPEGPVVYNQYLCVGCRYCMMACPFDIIRYEWEQAIPGISKCQMCVEKVEAGETPSCVSACPKGALKYGKRADLLREAKERIAAKENGVSYIGDVFGEKEAGGTSWLYITDVPFEDMRFRTDVTTKPLPSYTENYMKMTPIIGVSWAAILSGIYIFTHSKNSKKKSTESDQ